MSGSMRAGAFAALAACGLFTGGCLVSGHSDEKLSGAYVGQNTFNQIEPGSTTEKWVTAVLGAPTTSTEMEDGSTLMRWSYTKQKSSGGAVLFVFGSSSKKEEAGSCYVQVKNGVVTKAWRD